MNDCPNGDVRDLLPDLLHGRLDADAGERVGAHVAACADCQAELALLREVRTVMSAAPRIDVASIVAAVPPYRVPARRSWVSWQAAAAITVLVAGGSSIGLIQRGVAPLPDSASVVAVPVPVAQPAPLDAPSAQAPTGVTNAPVARAVGDAAAGARLPQDAAGGRELAMAGGAMTDLSDRELESLLRELESLDALMPTEVLASALAPVAPARGAP